MITFMFAAFWLGVGVMIGVGIFLTIQIFRVIAHCIRGE